jgi:hypothetical protein
MFTFFGVFTDFATNLAEEILHRWADADVVEVSTPFHGFGIRFQKSVYKPEKEDVPEPMSQAIQEISRQNEGVRFLILRTECFGGLCLNWGEYILNGEIVVNEEAGSPQPRGDGTLRRLIGHLGVDIGPSEIFNPLSREFPWKTSGGDRLERH